MALIHQLQRQSRVLLPEYGVPASGPSLEPKVVISARQPWPPAPNYEPPTHHQADHLAPGFNNSSVRTEHQSPRLQRPVLSTHHSFTAVQTCRKLSAFWTLPPNHLSSSPVRMVHRHNSYRSRASCFLPLSFTGGASASAVQ